MIEERTVQDSMVETVHLLRPNHMNAAGRLFGGMLMQWLDEVAGLVAKKHARSNIITASVDNLRFIHGAYADEMVVIIGKITYVGNTSMEVRVDTYVENLSDGCVIPSTERILQWSPWMKTTSRKECPVLRSGRNRKRRNGKLRRRDGR